MLTPSRQLFDALLQAGYESILKNITLVHKANINAYPANLRDECILLINGDVVESAAMTPSNIYTLATELAVILDSTYTA